MGRKKIVFLDIDGTLALPGSSTPPESALRAIQTARNNGHLVFLCTGRSLHMTRPVLHYPFDGAVVSAGGLILCGDEVLFDHPMTAEELAEVRAALSDEDVFLVLESRDETYGDLRIERVLSRTEVSDKTANSELLRWKKILTEGFDVVDIDRYKGAPVYKMTFLAVRREPLERARRALEDRYEFVMQGFFRSVCNGEVIPRAFDKGQAVRRVCGRYGVPVAESIGFGDSMNDLPMIEAAGIGVCMGNGSEELKRRADRVCPPVEEDGLAAAFLELGLI